MDAKRSYKWTRFLPEVVAGINNMKRKILFNFSSHREDWIHRIGYVCRTVQLKMTEDGKILRLAALPSKPLPTNFCVKSSH